MTYTIIRAEWGNEDKSAVILYTEEVAAVAISERDAPEEWVAFVKWSEKNPVADLPPPLPPPPLPPKTARLESMLARWDLTVEDLKQELRLGT